MWCGVPIKVKDFLPSRIRDPIDSLKELLIVRDVSYRPHVSNAHIIGARKITIGFFFSRVTCARVRVSSLFSPVDRVAYKIFVSAVFKWSERRFFRCFVSFCVFA
jgi:hypothetical protein